MKWFRKPQPSYEENRTISKFLWFPVTINGETRWLERATFLQCWYSPAFRSGNPYWINVRWVDYS